MRSRTLFYGAGDAISIFLTTFVFIPAGKNAGGRGERLFGTKFNLRYTCTIINILLVREN
jgi:hypothetical protein